MEKTRSTPTAAAARRSARSCKKTQGRPPIPAAPRRDRVGRQPRRRDLAVRATATPAVRCGSNATGRPQDARHHDRQHGPPMAVLFIEEKPKLVEKDGQYGLGEPNRKETVINDATHQRRVLEPVRDHGAHVVRGAGSRAAAARRFVRRADRAGRGDARSARSLGQDNIDRGIRATIIGYLLVVVFISLYYRFMGVLADVALLANVVMLVSVMSVVGFVADAARHRGHRADDGYGHRRERADLRAHP